MTAVVLVLVSPTPAAAAQAPVDLGTAGSFAVLAGAGITNTGATTITGDVGSFPTPAQTGFQTVTLNGANHGSGVITQQAKTDLTTAYNDASGRSPETAVATELGGTTLTPGVYASNTLGITGTLTLDMLGDPHAVFIFKTNSSLVTAVNSKVVILNGSTACNVFWRVPSSATLGANSHLVGTVLASTAITLGTGATVDGRLLAGTASATLQNNLVNSQNCVSNSAPTTTDAVPADTDATPAGEQRAPGAGTDAADPNRTRASGRSGDSSTGQARGTTPGTSELAETGFNEQLALGGGAAVLTGTLLLAFAANARRLRGIHFRC